MQYQEMSMCCFSTTKIFTTAQCSRLSQLLIAVELCSSSRNGSSRPSILVQCWNDINYCQELELRTTVQIGILDKCQGGHLEQQWIYAYRYHQYSTYSSMSIDHNIFDVHCPYQAMSSMSIVHINYCRYQSFPTSKLIIQCCQTNITRQQPMFQMSNEMSIVTRATTGERKPNGSLPKLRGVPYEFWGYKNKINSS